MTESETILKIVLEIKRTLEEGHLKLTEDIELIRKYQTQDYYQNKNQDRKLNEIERYVKRSEIKLKRQINKLERFIKIGSVNEIVLNKWQFLFSLAKNKYVIGACLFIDI